MSQIAITHLGLCTPLGQDPQQVLTGLIQADISAMAPRDDLIPGQSTLVGQVNTPLSNLPPRLAKYDCRNNRLLLCAAQGVSAAVTAASQKYGAHRIGVVLGTSTSGIAQGEDALARRESQGDFPADFRYLKQELGSTSEFLRDYFELDGPCYTISTACSSSAKAFASARRLLDAGLCDLVIVGGADSLCRLTLNGFHSLESISAGHCNPFSHNRDGINIGEAAALFTLMRAQDADTYGEQLGVMLAGFGESSDAHHISAPHPEGDGAVAAMCAALQDANICAADIDYVNLHGTATPKNDAMESLAMTRVFDPLPPLSSTKPLTGHALGAAGALEAAFCCLLLSRFNPELRLPPQVWDGAQDPQNPVLPLVQPGQIAARLNTVMSNSFAFGGSNASLIFCRAGQDSTHQSENPEHD